MVTSLLHCYIKVTRNYQKLPETTRYLEQKQKLDWGELQPLQNTRCSWFLVFDHRFRKSSIHSILEIADIPFHVDTMHFFVLMNFAFAGVRRDSRSSEGRPSRLWKSRQETRYRVRRHSNMPWNHDWGSLAPLYAIKRSILAYSDEGIDISCAAWSFFNTHSLDFVNSFKRRSPAKRPLFYHVRVTIPKIACFLGHKRQMEEVYRLGAYERIDLSLVVHWKVLFTYCFQTRMCGIYVLLVLSFWWLRFFSFPEHCF